MNQSLSAIETIDFPSLPAPLTEKYSAEDLNFRLFGTEKEDLAVNFSQTDLPDLVKRILSQCTVSQTKSLPEHFFLDMSAGKRLECLLRLAAGAEKSAFSFPFGCGACGQQLELELTLAEIAEIQSEADRSETVSVEAAGEKFIIRKPLGRDQQDWQNRIFADEQTAIHSIFNSLRVSEKQAADFDDEILPLVEEALDEADPLINFNCRVGCFECGATNEFHTDLLDFALAELRRSQWRLFYAVHRLASRYHWSEGEIFAVPYWRRRQYLALIADEKTK
jgi:hypothetical protein